MERPDSARYAFAAALIVLRDKLGLQDEFEALRREWKHVPVGDLLGETDRFVDARFDAHETTEWGRLVRAGALPDDATLELIERRRAAGA